MNDSVSDELETIIADYLRAMEAGEAIDIEAWIGKYPPFESELRLFLQNYRKFDALVKPLRSSMDMATLPNTPHTFFPPNDPSFIDSTPKGPPPHLRYFGDFELLNEIARGGMGIVFRAKQITLDRIVAIKMILGGNLASSDSEARFRIEAQAAASLDHPNIVPIFEVGEHEGQRYFSMKLIEGRSLSELLKQKAHERLSIEQAVRMMATVARAVHHAHQRGILHRDIKPGNILIDANLQPHVTDFGLAKRFEENQELTQSDALVGTPNYMAPEQAKGERNLTTAVDVFSLGAVLFELLFEVPPHRGPTAAATIASILSTDSIKFPARTSPLDADLETILWKCLQYQPDQRYPSAAAFAEDLESWLDGRPISARRSNIVEQLAKWSKRNPTIATLAATLVLTFLISFTIIIREWQVALMARQSADATASRAIAAESKERDLRLHSDRLRIELQQERDLLDRTRYLAQMQLAGREWQAGVRSNLEELLEHQVNPKTTRDPRSWEWFFLNGQLRGSVFASGFKHFVSNLVWEPNGHRLAASGYNANQSTGRLYVIDANTGKFDPGFGDDVPYSLNDVIWSPDGKWLAVGGGTSTGFENRIPGFLNVWNANGIDVSSITGHLGVVQSLSWSPDSQRLVAASGSFGPPGQVKIWDPSSCQMTHELKGLKNQPVSVEWSPDGTRIAGASSNGELAIWNADSGELLRQWNADRQSIRTLRWSPDSNLLLTDNPRHSLNVWDPKNESIVQEFHFNQEIPIRIEWVSNRTLEIVFNDSKCVSIDIDSQKSIERKKKGLLLGANAAMSPDRARMAFLQQNQVLAIEPLQPEVAFQTIVNPDSQISSVRWSPDGMSIATAGENVAVWNASTQKREAWFPWPNRWHVVAAEFSPDGNRIATSSYSKFSGTIHILNRADQKIDGTWNGHVGPVTSIHWSLDGKCLATLGFDNMVRFWNASKSDELIAEWSKKRVDLHSMARHPKQDLLAIGCETGEVALLAFPQGEKPTLNVKAIRKLHEQYVRAICWSSDGSLLATSGSDGIKLWSGDNLDLLQSISTRQPFIESIAFRPPKGDEPIRLAALIRGKTIKIWDAETGREALTLPSEGAVSFSWSPDGDRLIVANQLGECKIWNAGTGRAVDGQDE